MKKIKNGFSLAEVLLAATIAAIIATIGFTVAKKGIEKSYNLYIYSGYNAISLVINDAANGHGYKIQDCDDLSSDCDFTKHIYNLLSGRGNDPAKFTTPNGIRYEIYKHGQFALEGDEEGDTHYEYRIAMTVPSVKTKTSNTKRICMSYQPDRYKNFLIPIGYDSNDVNCRSNNMISDIASRKDLLAFYFDDGWRGKVIDKNYQPRYFRSAEEIACLLYGKIESKTGASNILTESTCTTVKNNIKNNIKNLQKFEENIDENSIIIRITDPRRI